jgi:hypothetical protein
MAREIANLNKCEYETVDGAQVVITQGLPFIFQNKINNKYGNHESGFLSF